MCFLALLYGTHRARTSPAWCWLMTMSFCFLVLVKGAFAMFALVGAALWLLVVPPPAGRVESLGVGGSRRRRGRRGADAGGLRSALRADDGRVVPRVLPVDAPRRVDPAQRSSRRAARARQRGLVSPQAGVVRRPVEPGRVCRGVGLAPLQGHRPHRRRPSTSGRARARVGAAPDGRVHRRAEPRARARRAVHLPDLLRDWRGGSRRRDSQVGGRPQSCRQRGSLRLAPDCGVAGDVPAQPGSKVLR